MTHAAVLLLVVVLLLLLVVLLLLLLLLVLVLLVLRCFFWRRSTTWTCLLRLYTHVNAGQDKGGSQEQASRRLYFFTQQRTDNGRDHKSQRVA